MARNERVKGRCSNQGRDGGHGRLTGMKRRVDKGAFWSKAISRLSFRKEKFKNE